jgi:ribosomal protein RSM22 (predicted rRNA methylase)
METLPPEVRRILDSVPSLIEKTFPMPGRFRSGLPSQIAELSGLLTGARGDRSLSYLSRPNFLSAYLRYFLPWNLYRLCRLLANIDIPLCAEDTIADLGSGPLTFVSALWIARPDLRPIPLEFHCIDRSAPALEAGEKLFNALRECGAENTPWQIRLVREDIDIRRTGVTRKGKKAALVCAVNLFNELYEKLPHNNGEALKRVTADIARIMHNYASESALILTAEPGVPQSGRFISFLRSAFLEMGRPPLSPCTHSAACPLLPRKNKWCHFAFETGDVSKDLHRLSAAARLPKERLVFSYLLAGPVSHNAVQTPSVAVSGARTLDARTLCVRVISDAFALPDRRFGRYGCCACGLVLLAGSKSRVESIVPASLLTLAFAEDGPRDAKSGALIIELQE